MKIGNIFVFFEIELWMFFLFYFCNINLNLVFISQIIVVFTFICTWKMAVCIVFCFTLLGGTYNGISRLTNIEKQKITLKTNRFFHNYFSPPNLYIVYLRYARAYFNFKENYKESKKWQENGQQIIGIPRIAVYATHKKYATHRRNP